MTLTSSFRLSSVSGGMLMRTIFPSFKGFKPRSDFWIAFSISPVILESQGWIMMIRLSGTEREATWASGVGTP
jgi:hypothetical protein